MLYAVFNYTEYKHKPQTGLWGENGKEIGYPTTKLLVWEYEAHTINVSTVYSFFDY